MDTFERVNTLQLLDEEVRDVFNDKSEINPLLSERENMSTTTKKISNWGTYLSSKDHKHTFSNATIYYNHVSGYVLEGLRETKAISNIFVYIPGGQIHLNKREGERFIEEFTEFIRDKESRL